MGRGPASVGQRTEGRGPSHILPPWDEAFLRGTEGREPLLRRTAGRGPPVGQKGTSEVITPRPITPTFGYRGEPTQCRFVASRASGSRGVSWWCVVETSRGRGGDGGRPYYSRAVASVIGRLVRRGSVWTRVPGRGWGGVVALCGGVGVV